jgi:ABC-type ATPase involved in cell division
MNPLGFISWTGTILRHALAPPSPSLRDRTGAAGPYETFSRPAPRPSPLGFSRYHHSSVIHFYHVTKRFDRDHVALQDVSFQIEKGEFVFLSGASGAGKSTLLRLILRQLVPTEGQILVNGRNLAALKRVQLPFFRREIGMVFQDFKLIERMTVFENLSFVMTVLGIPAKEQKRKAYAVLRAVNLQQRLNAFPASSPAASSSGWRSRGR